jgi:hypothetical protein
LVLEAVVDELLGVVVPEVVVPPLVPEGEAPWDAAEGVVGLRSPWVSSTGAPPPTTSAPVAANAAIRRPGARGRRFFAKDGEGSRISLGISRFRADAPAHVASCSPRHPRLWRPVGPRFTLLHETR